jgi:hypothetical protein
MRIYSWQFIHLVLSIVFVALIVLIIKMGHFKANKNLRIILLSIAGLLFINSFATFLIITIHYMSFGL